MIVYVYNDLLNLQKNDGWKIALESRLQYDAVSNLHILLKQAKLVVNPFFKIFEDDAAPEIQFYIT